MVAGLRESWGGGGAGASGIDDVLRGAGEKGAEVIGDGEEETLACGAGGPCEVRGDEAVGDAEERVVRGRGFGGEDVEGGGGDGVVAEGGGEGGFVDERAAGGVDEEGGGFHGGEPCGVDHA